MEYNEKQYRQIEKETKDFAFGVNFQMSKYKDAVENGTVVYHGAMAAVTLKLTKDMIDNFGDFQKSKSDAAYVIELIGPELVSNAVADILVTGACRKESRQAVFENVKNALADMAVELELTRGKDKKVKSYVNYVLSGAASAREIRNAIDEIKERTGVDVVDDAEMFQLAQYLVFKLVDRSGLFTTVDIPYDEDDFTVDATQADMQAFTFTDEALTRFEGLAQQIAERSVGHEPLVCEPLEWDNYFTGGYYTDSFKVPAIKRGGAHYAEFKEYIELVESKEDRRYLDALNEVQKTPFKVNKDVLKLAQTILKLKGGLMGLADVTPINVNAKRTKADKEEAKLEEIKRAGKARADKAAIDMAAKYATEEELYFVYQADFRGRLYNCCSDLNTQGDDLHKGLLQFAKGKALGESGYKWLCIHAANTYGGEEALDKKSFEDRVAWVEKNRALIKRVATGNLKEKHFRSAMNKAENPFMFYAVCKELAKVIGKSPKVQAKFVSHIPVGMDGSCNGQQWAAGFLASLELAINVNLVKSSWTDTPNDLYRSVADGMVEYFETYSDMEIAIEATPKNGTQVDDKAVAELKKAFLNAEPSVQRKLCKRATMTEAYAVTDQGQRDMLWVDVPKFRKQFSKDALRVYKAVYGKALKYGLGKACMASRKSMDFFKSCAKAIGDNVVYVTNPIGFVLKQDYRKEISVTKCSQVAKRNLNVNYKIKTDQVNGLRQVSAIAPNVTHSHDSAHMLMTVMACQGNDMSWHLVHDDFGCHACDVDKMNYEIRKTFVEIHKQDRLNVLREEIIAQGGDESKIMADPRENDFDIEDVMESTYFFA